MAHKTIIRETVPEVAAKGPEAEKVSPECRHCYGSGQVLESVEVAFDWYEDQASKCPRCKGSGKAGRR